MMKNDKLAFRPSLDIRDGGVTESSHRLYIANKYRAGHFSPRFTERQIAALRKDWDENFKGDQSKHNRDTLLREFTRKYNSSPQNLRLILSNRSWKNVTLCEYPYVITPVNEVYKQKKNEREFLQRCIKEAALELALKKGIYNVRYDDVQRRAGVGRLDRIYKKLHYILDEIEPEYVKRKYEPTRAK